MRPSRRPPWFSPKAVCSSKVSEARQDADVHGSNWGGTASHRELTIRASLVAVTEAVKEVKKLAVSSAPLEEVVETDAQRVARIAEVTKTVEEINKEDPRCPPPPARAAAPPRLRRSGPGSTPAGACAQGTP